MVKLTQYNESNQESSRSLRTVRVNVLFTPGGSKVALSARLYDTAATTAAKYFYSNFRSTEEGENFKSSETWLYLFKIMKKIQKPIFSAIYANVQKLF